MGTQCGLVVYYYLEDNKTPLGRIIFQSKIKGRIQLGGADKVGRGRDGSPGREGWGLVRGGLIAEGGREGGS